MATSQAIAVVIGLCSHGLSVARALHNRQITVIAVEQNNNLPGTATSSVSKLYFTKDFSASSILKCLSQIRENYNSDTKLVLFPTNDNHVRIIGEYFKQLEQDFLISWAEKRKTVLQLLDKTQLEAFSEQAGLNYPKSAIIEAKSEISLQLNAFSYPLIVKPAKPLSSFKTLIAEDLQQLNSIISDHTADLPLVVQEFIPGGDRSLFFGALMLNAGNVVQGMVGRKIASYPVARGQTTIAETVDHGAVMDATVRFFAPFNLSGPVSLELKQDPAGKLWVIEPTIGRTDFWSELCISAGFNQPYQEFLIALGQQVPVLPITAARVWYDSERAPLAYFKACWVEKTLYPFGKKPVFTYLSNKDIRPFIMASRNLLKRIINKTFKSRTG